MRDCDRRTERAASPRQRVPHFLFLSPHFDDVALSCGGSVRHYAAGGARVSVLTVCAGKPGNTPLSAFAQDQHRRWGNPRDPIATRAAEDRAAMRLLGARALHLPIPDAIYRRKASGAPLVRSNRSLFGSGYATETALAEEVARRAQVLALRAVDSIIVAPLGTGRHVDHLLIRDAALQLLAGGHSVRWYEELPYAEARGAVARALRAFGERRWKSEIVPIEIAPKLRAIAQYKSQLGSTFRGAADMRARIRAYAARTGGGTVPYAERFWTIADKNG